MKKFYAILCLAIVSLTQLPAQAPQGFNYQATVRNSSGDLIINTNVYFKFNVIQGSQTSLPVFTEIHYVPTDDLGQVTLVIGQGTATTGAFSSIDWSLGSYYLGIELSINGANNYVAMGTTQLLSVPYALYAENSGNSTSTTPNLETVLAENNSANNQQIKDLQDPTEAQDAVTKAYIDAQIAEAVAGLQSQIDALQAMTGSGSVTDQDGNSYPYLTYGDQVWTVKNAEMVTYRDGTEIPQVTDPTEWYNLSTGAWCYYNNDPTKPRLYNWYAVMGIHDNDENTPNKEFAPEGWHVPTDAEWTALETYLIANGYNYDGTTTGNKIAKAMASTTGWISFDDTGAVGNDQSLNNSSGFNAFPEGFRISSDGSFSNEGSFAFFWSSTENNNDTNFAWFRYLGFNYINLYRSFDGYKPNGFSVRFVRDGDVDSNEIDDDNDGYTENQGDCDDTNASINPGANEIEDGIDNNCDGEIDEPGFEDAPTPTTDSDDVISVFSDAYENVPVEFYNGYWQPYQSTEGGEVVINGQNVIHYTNFNFVGTKLVTPLDISEMTHFSIDILMPVDLPTDIDMLIVLKNENPAAITLQQQRIGGQTDQWSDQTGDINDTDANATFEEGGVWKTIKIPLRPTSETGLDKTGVNLIIIERIKSSNVTDFHIDNMYFFKEDPTHLDTDDDNDGYTENQGDCDDTNASINPGATEIEDNIDNDCDGEVDEVNGGGGGTCSPETTESYSAANVNMTFQTDPSADFISDGAGFSWVDNPDFDNAVNTSCKVGQVVRGNNNPWDNNQYDLDAKLDFNANTGLKIKVWSARPNTEVRLKLEEIGNAGNNTEQFLTTSVTSGWEDLTFPFTAADSNKFNKIVLFFDLNTNSTDTYYFDDLRLYGDGSDSGGVGGSITDQDGNTYDYLTYGDQVWTVENAEMVTYRDGTPIPQVTNNTEWEALTTGAWSYYNNDPTKPRLYNWYAVMGIHDNDENTPNKEFAPEGWHVPTDAEWTTLENQLIYNGYNYDDTTTENKIAKAMASTTGWSTSTELGAVGNDQSLNNSSGFNAFPEGYRHYNGSFFYEGDFAIFWSSTGSNTDFEWGRNLGNDYSFLSRDGSSRRNGFSVRFVRD